MLEQNGCELIRLAALAFERDRSAACLPHDPHRLLGPVRGGMVCSRVAKAAAPADSRCGRHSPPGR